MSWKTIFFAASPVPGRIRGDGGRRERVRGVPQIGRGKGRRLGASTKRASSSDDGISNGEAGRCSPRGGCIRSGEGVNRATFGGCASRSDEDNDREDRRSFR